MELGQVGSIWEEVRESKNAAIMHNADNMVLCTTDMSDLGGQLREVSRIADKYGVVFNSDTIKIGRSIMIDGILVTCQTGSQPTLIFNPEESSWPVKD